MMEHICEEQLALYATGDLSPNESGAVAKHVQNCETCQAIVAGFREAQSFVASALMDPTADELIEVRERIRLNLRERRRWIGWIAAAAAAVVAVILIGVESKPPAVPEPALPVAQLKLPEVPHFEIPQLRTAVLRHREAGIRSVDLIARADQPPLIKMTTADPNVVILWQSNEGMKNE